MDRKLADKIYKEQKIYKFFTKKEWYEMLKNDRKRGL